MNFPLCSVAAILATFAMALNFVSLHAQEPPFPIGVPENWQEFLGDPDRAPERQARYAKSHRVQHPPITWPINQGNPFTDWGHFRMREEAAGRGRMGRGLSPTFPERGSGRDGIAELHNRFQTQDWQDGKLLRYSLLLPDPEESPMPEGGYPLVISCPGAGGVGDQGLGSSKVHSAAVWATDYYRKNMPAVVIVLHPQSRSITYTGDASQGEFDIGLNPSFHAYVELIDHYVRADGINPRRVSVYGHSMGGSSVWALVRERPQLFSAAMALAGSPFGNPADYAKLNHTPMWIMMGHDDPWNGSHSYIAAYKYMLDAGHPQVRFWEIQDIRHSSSPLSLYHVHQWLWHQVRD
ncbi:MAG: hypothetical protein EA401_00175 [Planctomycetota bacterium]|nr:MAG: hypothetical protein EA401_00175 [Planctomycetota bacterium]